MGADRKTTTTTTPSYDLTINANNRHQHLLRTQPWADPGLRVSYMLACVTLTTTICWLETYSSQVATFSCQLLKLKSREPWWIPLTATPTQSGNPPWLNLHQPSRTQPPLATCTAITLVRATLSPTLFIRASPAGIPQHCSPLHSQSDGPKAQIHPCQPSNHNFPRLPIST